MCAICNVATRFQRVDPDSISHFSVQNLSTAVQSRPSQSVLSSSVSTESFVLNPHSTPQGNDEL